MKVSRTPTAATVAFRIIAIVLVALTNGGVMACNNAFVSLVFQKCNSVTRPPTPSPTLENPPTGSPSVSPAPTAEITEAPTIPAVICESISTQRTTKYSVDANYVGIQRNAPGYAPSDFASNCASSPTESSYYQMFAPLQAQQLVRVTLNVDAAVAKPVALFGMPVAASVVGLLDSLAVFDPLDIIFRRTRGLNVVFSENVIILAGASYVGNSKTEIIIDGTGGSVQADRGLSYGSAAIMIDATVSDFTMIISSKVPFFAMAWKDDD